MTVLASAVPTMSLLFALLSVLAEVLVAAALALWLGARFSPAMERAREGVRRELAHSGLWLAWAVATTCTLGSLYLSELAHFVPCKLCWYQRICMYPLVVLLLVAALKRSREIARATLPLIAIGAALSTYHYLLERFPSMSGAATCDPASPCTILWIWRFHYLSIPAMALSGFLLIAALIVATPKDPIGEIDHTTTDEG